MTEVAQPAGDFSDPPVSDLVIIQAVSDGFRQRSDLGGGRFEGRSRSGDLFLIAPETATDILVHNSHVIRCFAFPAATLRPHLEDARQGRDPFDFGRLHAGPFRNLLLLGLLDKLWDEAERGDPVTRMFADGAILAIAAELVRQEERPLSVSHNGLAPWRLRRATEYLEARLAEDVGLAEAAAEVQLSPDHFTRAFRAATGLPPHRWLMRRRVERACELLTDPRHSITEIAFACGFASSQHLATVFRKQVGTTPSEYRRDRLL